MTHRSGLIDYRPTVVKYAIGFDFCVSVPYCMYQNITIRLLVLIFIVPTPSYGGGEELYTQMGFFLFSEFWPIDIFIVETYEWYH